MNGKISSYKEFYKFYLGQHSNRICRLLHFISTLSVIMIILSSIINSDIFILIFIPFVGYGFAWVGHFFFENNKPATFEYPFWSLISDFRMFFEILIGIRSFDTSKD